MQDLSWMKNPTVVVLLAVLAVFAIDQLVWNGDKYANLAGVAETPTCLAYSSGKLIPAGNLEMDPDRARSYSKTDVRTHDRPKLLNILDQCTADSCPAELQADLKKFLPRSFHPVIKDFPHYLENELKRS